MNIAIVGATGLVGSTFLTVLEEYNFPITNLYLFSSAKSAGKQISFCGKSYIVEELNESSFDRPIDIALFSAGGDISKQFAPIAVQKSCLVIDNSSAWRMDPSVPLIVPEVNAQDAFAHKGIIANPNCSTIQSVLPLHALQKIAPIKRVIYNTYQSVSGSGIKGIEDLQQGLEGKAPGFYPHPIAHNAIPHIDTFTENGYTKEEIKMINETRKILNSPDLQVTATCVRIPSLNGHSVSINVEFEKEVDLNEIRQALQAQHGIKLCDVPFENCYPTNHQANGQDEVLVGRIRKDFSAPHGINLWCSADNIRKGAASNTIQIAQLFLKN